MSNLQRPVSHGLPGHLVDFDCLTCLASLPEPANGETKPDDMNATEPREHECLNCGATLIVQWPDAAPPADAPLDVERWGRAMHKRLGHSNKFGNAQCRCWGEARAIAAEDARLRDERP